ncbi:hypothetical protein GCM10007862_02150 [Dyella lipolytica]|uniref:DUF6916 domain-containing protein n=1 Tax=Dyella lipolytica TaxID=1867835 RepID=A0ABW8IRN4_9GAMM|nr:hypothetical protein [Dyella lipolytica]GLQ45164.1 hypothetical protein GCM10007862_02150 [Dyella lipolytica]
MQFLTLEQFATRLNENFSVDVDQGRTPFTLVEAKPLPVHEFHGMMRAPFSLLFHNASPVLFPQRIYQMGNPGIGEFGIFLVPVARNQDGFLYQAVFN